MVPNEENNSVEEESRVAELLRSLKEKRRLVCTDCSSGICSHEYILNIVMGLKDAPRCVSCLCASLDRDKEGFLTQVAEYVDDKVCYRTAWKWASENEGFAGEGLPPCLNAKNKILTPDTQKIESQSGSTSLLPDLVWDAVDLSCGDLVLQLRIRLQSMKPGTILELTAKDPAAPIDLPAWCGLTGNPLVSAAHPVYLIKKK